MKENPYIIKEFNIKIADIALKSDGLVHVLFKKDNILDVPAQMDMLQAYGIVTEGKLTPFIFEAEERFTVTKEARDNATTVVTARHLRQYCPCAECVEEWSGKRTYDPEVIAADMRVLELGQVGNYALCFTFADAHRTGIYNWEYLRELATTPGAPR